MESAAQRTLRTVFGYERFRPGQQEAVDALMSGHDLLAVMPTGAGKSICYQVPALTVPGITLVISPLISLMRDQVGALLQAGVRAAYINSTLSPRQQMKALQNAAAGVYRIIYVAPERLLTDVFLAFAKAAPLSFVIVDEAHCVSQWGQDFRPGYLSILPFLQSLPQRPPVGAFTATATTAVRDDIERLLGLQNPIRVLTGFDRPNLRFEVRRPENRDAELLSFLRQHRGESGIVYCATRKSCEEVAGMLQENGIDAGCYHAGMADEDRTRVQEDFVSDRIGVIAATNAFGMGIDKSNVTFVVHYQMPKDLESYYQEAGRAGRDGSDAVCLLLYKPQDVRLQQFFIEHQQEQQEEGGMPENVQKTVRERSEARLKEMTFYAVGRGCLRARILRYFGETAPEHCGNCSGCSAMATERDVTQEAQKAVSLVSMLNGRFGRTILTDVLLGRNTGKNRELELNRLSLFGALKGMGEPAVHALLDELVSSDVLAAKDGQYPTLRTGEHARALLRGDWPVILSLPGEEQRAPKRIPEPEAPARKPGRRLDGTPAVENVPEALYTRLSELRRRIAKEQHVPPFLIFTNMTLRDMALKRPRSMEAMRRVSGVGEHKLERYGSAFLSEVLAWEEGHS